MNGFCSKNILSSYRYGVKVSDMLKEVKEHKSRGDFSVVAELVPEPVDQRPIEPTVGFYRMLDEAWGLLMDKKVGTMGIYGMGGVGKTTLLTQLNNKFCKAMNGFDIVIWVTVSREGRIERVQEEIRKFLRLYNERWVGENEETKANEIHRILSRQKFVLLLDDVQSEIDVKKIGVPYPDQENGCKIAFTARSKEVRMSVDAELEVPCLEPEDAWDLFRKQVGEVTLSIDEAIPQLAREMADKCRGLPLALTVIGRAMSCKRTVHEWQDAMHYFTSPQSQFPGMTDQILPVLRFSYDELEDETFKLCFLYCALFPEDFEIEKEALIDYWIANGFIQSRSRDLAVNHGYMIIGKLVHAYLLRNDEAKGTVTMHDLVREMALRTARLSPYNEFSFTVKSGTSLLHIPDYNTDKWRNVRYMSLMCNQIREVVCRPNCPELLALFLHNNDLVKVSSDFFSLMPKLAVLDLSRNYNLLKLPDISMLSCLRYLDLSHTDIKLLPSGIDKLDSLIHLNLEFTTELLNVYAILCLRKLQVLKLLGSRSLSGDAAISMILSLENLQLLTLSIEEASCYTMLQHNFKLATWIQVLSFRSLVLPSITIQVGPFSDSLRCLEIRDSLCQRYIQTMEHHLRFASARFGKFMLLETL